MLAYHQLVYLIHILLVGPIFIYVGYAKKNTPNLVFNVLLIIGIVVVVYHGYLLNKSKQYIKVI